MEEGKIIIKITIILKNFSNNFSLIFDNDVSEEFILKLEK